MSAGLPGCAAASSGRAEGLMPRAKFEYLLRERGSSNMTSRGPCLPSVGFVGIGKTGSLFMQSALELFAHEQLLTTNNPAVRSCGVGARMGWHHASALLWRRAFGERAWKEAFTFALVRDPWARLVSHWAFHIASRAPLDGGHLSQEERRVAKANESHSIRHFRAWVMHARAAHPPWAADAWRFTTADGHGNERAKSFNASQLSWLVDETGATELVDDVFKLEDLERRWPELQAKVCGLRHISYSQTKNHPAVRAMDHPSHHAPYAHYYDAETSRIVGEYMAPDVRRFGYRPPLLTHSNPVS